MRFHSVMRKPLASWSALLRVIKMVYLHRWDFSKNIKSIYSSRSKAYFADLAVELRNKGETVHSYLQDLYKRCVQIQVNAL